MNLSRNERREARERKHNYYRVQGDWEGGGFGYTIPAANEAEAREWGEQKARFHPDAEITVIPRGPVEPEPAAPALRKFRVLAVCGGRAVGQPLEVYGTDAMSVAKAHIGWAATEGYGAHPQVLPVEEPAAPVSDIFSADPMDAREREELRRAIQDETQLALTRGW